jgi:hypothetical protein
MVVVSRETQSGSGVFIWANFHAENKIKKPLKST